MTMNDWYGYRYGKANRGRSARLWETLNRAKNPKSSRNAEESTN
jgi:hypothetical protein